MRKIISALLVTVIVLTLCATMAVSASASETPSVLRLTPTATELKLADDNMDEATAISVCTARMGNELSTYAIYSKTADGKYNYLSCAVNTGWYKAGTASFEEIIAKGGIYGVMFVGTFTDVCEPVDYCPTVKEAGAAVTTFNFPAKDFHICSQEELGYVQNEINEDYAGVGNVICLVRYFNEKENQVQIMQFEKMNANKDCVAVGLYGECKTYADYITNFSANADVNAKYIVAEVLAHDMVEGKDQDVDLTKVDSVTFRSDAEFDSFVMFMIDNKIVDKSYYTAKEGSTIIEVKKDYLNTLSNGKHSVTVVSKEGLATTEFTLSGSQNIQKASSSNTGDSLTVAIWFMVAFMCVSALYIVYRKRENA